MYAPAMCRKDKQIERLTQELDLRCEQNLRESAEAKKEIERLTGKAKELFRATDLMHNIYWPIDGQQELTYAQKTASDFALKVLVRNKDVEPTNEERKMISKNIK